MICPPCRDAADMDQHLPPEVTGGHPPETCRDHAIRPHGCPCAHGPAGTAIDREERTDA